MTVNVRNPAALGLLHHPEQRDVAQALVRIAAAHIRVHAREPDLLQTGRIRPGLPSMQLFLMHLVPQQWMKVRTLVIDGQRMASTLHSPGERMRSPNTIGQSPPSPIAALQLVDRHAIRFDGVPDAEEADTRLIFSSPSSDALSAFR